MNPRTRRIRKLRRRHGRAIVFASGQDGYLYLPRWRAELLGLRYITPRLHDAAESLGLTGSGAA